MPAGYAILSGNIHNGTGAVSRLYTNDDSRVEITGAWNGSTSVSELYAHATIASTELATLQSLRIDFDGNARFGSSALTLSVYNWTTSSWQVVDGPRTGVGSDYSFSWQTAVSPANYVSAGGEIRFKIRGTRSNGVMTRTDLVHFRIEY